MFQRKQRGNKDMESLLRAERPEPSPDLVDDLVRRIESEPVAGQAHRPRGRLAIAGLVTGALIAVGVAFGVLSDGRDAAADSAASAAKAVRTAIAPAATSNTDQVAANTSGSQTAVQPAASSAESVAGSVGKSDATQVAGAPTTDETAKTLSQGTGLTDTRRYLAQLTYEPVTWPGGFPVWICHSTGGSYNNGNGTGRQQANSQGEYEALVAAHLGHPFDKGVYASRPNCTQDAGP